MKKTTNNISILSFLKGNRILILIAIILIAIQIALEVLSSQYVQSIINLVADEKHEYQNLTSSQKQTMILRYGELFDLVCCDNYLYFAFYTSVFNFKNYY
ncbi:hypothetical protein [Mycoplasmopsis cynos]|uniref:hypothetical protein n=1 Tax=Mycoplasmopsis cynos TaxID=171284 RepID=UPI0024C91FFD|nr:hypothetical protein [Mycoplasmopsis cynos]WAM04301.1 hypothetical protein ONA01_04595 [Mycoplasmopsis cynos]